MEEYTERLKNLLNEYEKVWENPKLFKDLILEYFPDDRLLRNLLISSVDEGIPKDLFVLHRCSINEKNRLITRLTDNYGLSKENADRILKLWGNVFQVDFENENDKECNVKVTPDKIAAGDCEEPYGIVNPVDIGMGEDEGCDMSLDNLEMSVNELNLSVRSYNCLTRAGIFTVEQLCQLSIDDLMRVRNLGKKCAEDIEKKLEEFGLTLKPSQRTETPIDIDVEHGLSLGSSEAETRVSYSDYGKDKCKTLKKVRKTIADANNISYKLKDCTYDGACSGTCPACEAEAEYIMKEIEKKKAEGKSVVLENLIKVN